MTLEEIRELIQLVSETGVAELEVQRGENRVRIRLSFGHEAQHSASAFHQAESQGMEAPVRLLQIKRRASGSSQLRLSRIRRCCS